MVARLFHLFALSSVFVLLAGLSSCSRLYEKTVMFHIYRSYHDRILDATRGTPISSSYLASLVSLESNPPGNELSKRFEPGVYQKLQLAIQEERSFGHIPFQDLSSMSELKLRQYASSYGLTQIMGYHCYQLGCEVEQLSGPDHLDWAVRYMVIHYGRSARQQKWADCFRIHNTGHPTGQTSRNDYVKRGLARMEYYQALEKKQGSLIPSLLD